ncbi:MAG: hypothetical protein PHE27_09440 [Alphaproteobacteria bacterium]|nr:hypothetical protein [Alphaproteobacteria bacterium]
MNAKTATPIVKVLPTEGSDPSSDATLQPVRKALLNPETNMLLKFALKDRGIKALVVTPEYNDGRMLDTGKELVFHYLLNNVGEMGVVALAQTNEKIEDILGVDGFASPFDKNHMPDVTTHTHTDIRDNPFSRILKDAIGQTTNSRATHPG